MKTLIAVVNARSRQGWADAIRKTWKPLVPADKADVFFFVGRGEGEVPGDTVVLNCDDSYMGLPEKIREIVRWAYAHDYDFVLKCDDDVVLNPVDLLSSGYENSDYTGRANRSPNQKVPCWVPMGFNYWLSRNSMQHVLNAPLPTEGNDDEKWVALSLFAQGIRLRDDQRYRLQYGEITMHPVEVKKVIWRPLQVKVNTDIVPGTFSWCIFLEGNSGNVIATERKIKEFHMVFDKHVRDVQAV